MTTEEASPTLATSPARQSDTRPSSPLRLLAKLRLLSFLDFASLLFASSPSRQSDSLTRDYRTEGRAEESQPKGCSKVFTTNDKDSASTCLFVEASLSLEVVTIEKLLEVVTTCKPPCP